MSVAKQDLMKLYSQRILALAAGISHSGRLDSPQGSAMRRSPLCGSTVTVDVVMAGDRVAEFAQDVKACALGQASAAVLGRVVMGLTRDEIARGRDELNDLIKNDGPTPAEPFRDLEYLRPAQEYKNRHASILLAWEAALAAIDAAIEPAQEKSATI